ncbi:hypothetical protein C6W10_27950 [Plantactinospora sp. BB1]|nr:hypothetical protein C6W10_27950 [Plantactinospora sp. BB1]
MRCRPADDGLKWWAEGISTLTEPPPTDRDHDGINDDRDEFPDDPHNTPRRFIRLTCQVGDDTRGFDIEAVPDKGADFTAIWAAKATSCDSDTVAPDSALEQKAHKASGYEEPDIGTLYSICGQVDPDDVYVDAGFAPSREQIAEISGALTLCATHPQAKKWRQAVKRGQADAKLEADGRLFPDGTYLVRKEIKPGTYVTTDVKDCYWERQNRSGEIIDNNFVPSARRVQVTIRSSDYGFMSERCGQWRPA